MCRIGALSLVRVAQVALMCETKTSKAPRPRSALKAPPQHWAGDKRVLIDVAWADVDETEAARTAAAKTDTEEAPAAPQVRSDDCHRAAVDVLEEALLGLAVAAKPLRAGHFVCRKSQQAHHLPQQRRGSCRRAGKSSCTF